MTAAAKCLVPRSGHAGQAGHTVTSKIVLALRTFTDGRQDTSERSYLGRRSSSVRTRSALVQALGLSRRSVFGCAGSASNPGRLAKAVELIGAPAVPLELRRAVIGGQTDVYVALRHVPHGAFLDLIFVSASIHEASLPALRRSWISLRAVLALWPLIGRSPRRARLSSLSDEAVNWQVDDTWRVLRGLVDLWWETPSRAASSASSPRSAGCHGQASATGLSQGASGDASPERRQRVLLLAWPVRGRAAAVIAVSAGTGR